MSWEVTCNRCHTSCNGCNSCNSCNIVIGLCDNGQKASDHLGSFKWSKNRTTISKDDSFLTKNEWDHLIDYIEDAYKLGNEHNAWQTYNNTYDEDINTNNKENAFMTAVMYNEAYRRMQNLSKDNRNTTYNIVEKDVSIVTAKLFNDLYNLANNFKLHEYQCNNCNNCNDCQRSCNSCDGCEGYYQEYCCHTEATT